MSGSLEFLYISDKNTYHKIVIYGGTGFQNQICNSTDDLISLCLFKQKLFLFKNTHVDSYLLL